LNKCIRYPNILCEIDPEKKQFTSYVHKITGVFRNTIDFEWGYPYFQLYPDSNTVKKDKVSTFLVKKNSIFFVQYYEDDIMTPELTEEMIQQNHESFKNFITGFCDSVKTFSKFLEAYDNSKVSEWIIVLVYFAAPEFLGDVLKEL